MSKVTLIETLIIYRKLKTAKEAVKKLESELAPHKEAIQGFMEKDGRKLIECTEGYATWVDRKGNTKWDAEALEKELGTDNIDKFRTVKEDSKYIKFGLYEPTDEE